jgi:hypothetical protein
MRSKPAAPPTAAPAMVAVFGPLLVVELAEEEFGVDAPFDDPPVPGVEFAPLPAVAVESEELAAEAFEVAAGEAVATLLEGLTMAQISFDIVLTAVSPRSISQILHCYRVSSV